jgi:hypothetical protein
VLFAAVAMTLLLGALTGGADRSEDAAAPTTTVPATTVPATCPAGADCAQRNVGGTTKTAVVLLAVAGGVALVWCRRRARQLLAA